MKIYVYRDDQVEGPFDDLIVQQALANGTMRPEQPCCREGSADWIPATTMFAAKQLTPALPPKAPRLQIPLPRLRWRWSFLFWAPVSFYFLVGLYGCFNIGNAIQNLEQTKANAAYELNQRNAGTHVASVLADAAIRGDRDGAAGAIQPLLSEAEQQNVLEEKIKEVDRVLPLNREKQAGSTVMSVLMVMLAAMFVGIKILVQKLSRRRTATVLNSVVL